MNISGQEETVPAAVGSVVGKTSIKRKFLAGALSFAFALTAAEMFCRVAMPSMRSLFPPGFFVSDPDPMISYRMAPNFSGLVDTSFFRYHIRTNSLGLRGAEPDISGGHKTIAVIGDSFAFGQGLEEADTIENVIAEKIDLKTTQVLNAGTYAYAPLQEIRVYHELVKKLHPETIVLVLNWNDVLDQTRAPERRLYKGDKITWRVPESRLVPSPPHSLWEGFVSEMIASSELAARVRFGVRQLEAMRTDLQPFMRADYDQILAKEIASTKTLLAGWIDEAAAAHQKMLITFVPDRLQIEPRWEDNLEQFRKKGRPVDPDAAQRWLVNFLKDHPSAKYVDVVEPLRQKARESDKPLYFPVDTHTNALGDRVIGEALAHALQ